MLSFNLLQLLVASFPKGKNLQNKGDQHRRGPQHYHHFPRNRSYKLEFEWNLDLIFCKPFEIKQMSFGL